MSELLGLLLLQDSASGASSLMGIVPIVLVFVVFYFFLIRPQQKERQRVEQETQAMLEALKSGDKVITNGGILGTIVAVRDDIINLRIADGVKIDVLKSSIARKTTESKPAQETK